MATRIAAGMVALTCSTPAWARLSCWWERDAWGYLEQVCQRVADPDDGLIEFLVFIGLLAAVIAGFAALFSSDTNGLPAELASPPPPDIAREQAAAYDAQTELFRAQAQWAYAQVEAARAQAAADDIPQMLAHEHRKRQLLADLPHDDGDYDDHTEADHDEAA